MEEKLAVEVIQQGRAAWNEMQQKKAGMDEL